MTTYLRTSTFALAAFALLGTAANADLVEYSQNFESLDQASQTALSNDGWNAFANVFNTNGDYAYGYYTPAPNNPDFPGFSLIVDGQGGPTQGGQQMSVFSDYNNTDHGLGYLINSNVYQEQTIGAADVGSIWRLSYDAKFAPDGFGVGGDSTAESFVRVLDSGTFDLLGSTGLDMTIVPETWGRFTLEILIDPAWVGQLLQFGFANDATNYEPSAVIYDNVRFNRVVPVPGALFLLGSGLFALMGLRRKHVQS